MSSVQIYSSSPAFVSTGIKDASTRPPVIEPEVSPIHAPLFYSFTPKGDGEARLLETKALISMHGQETLDYASKFCNHSTPYINGIMSEGNAIMFQRLIPEGAKKAWIRFSLGVLKVQMEHADIPGKTYTGYQLRWTTDVTTREETGDAGGRLTSEAIKLINDSGKYGRGLQIPLLSRLDEAANELSSGIGTDGTDQEHIYPIFDLEISNEGEYGNNLGLRLSAPNRNSDAPMNRKFYSNTLVRPFRVEMVKRLNKRSPATTVSNTSGESTTDFVFKPNTIDPVYHNDVYIGTSLLDNYRNLETTGGRLPTYGSFNAIKVYDVNIEHIVRSLFQAEADADALAKEANPLNPKLRLDYASNEDLERDSHWQIDFFTGLSSEGIPYRAVKVAGILDTDRDSTSLEADIDHWARGGEDGDVSIENYHRMVEERLLAFDDPTNPFLDLARYPFTCFYDTGFPMSIKRAMGTLISARKNVHLSFTPYEVPSDLVKVKVADASQPGGVSEVSKTVYTFNSGIGVEPMSRVTEASSVALISEFTRSRAESDIHGTGCVRANIIMQCGRIIGSTYRGLVPLNYEIAMKRAKYMGAGSGIMRPGYGYDQDGLKQLRYMNHVSNPFIPADKREINWTNGATWAQFYDRSTLFFPAVRSIYKDETSVLLSDINMCITTDLQNVCFRTWRRMVGDSRMTQAEFIDTSNTLIVQDVAGRYDGRVIVEPDTYFTQADDARGYSWHCDLHAYFNNMRTVGVFTTVVHRLSDLEGGK